MEGHALQIQAGAQLRERVRRRNGGAFTLIELLIVVTLLGLLAALVVPIFNAVGESPKVEVLATNVRTIQLMIVQKSTGAGYPPAIDPVWFSGGRFPYHTMSNQRMVIEVVSLPNTEIYPAVKTFDPNIVGDFSAWYNVTNGSFRARVIGLPDEAETIKLFNDSNKTSITAIDQTTE